MNNDFMRRSPDSKENDKIVGKITSGPGTGKTANSNIAWLAEQKIQSGVLLLGGVSVDHFRVRVAQSRYRDDLAPSFWSTVGILTADGHVITVPFDSLPYASRVPVQNGVFTVNMQEYDSVECFPNIAVLSYTDDMKSVEGAASKIMHSRAVLDLPSMLITWLSYLWATDEGSNPLRHGIGLPAAAFVETAFAACRIEVSPGQRTASSSPEAIWQSARWWSGFYTLAQSNDKTIRQPYGAYRITQVAAAAVGIRDDRDGDTIYPTKGAKKRSPRGK